MTDLPYTTDDLRAEAASQHHALTEDPDYMGIGERMDDDTVQSSEQDGGARKWGQLLPDVDDFDTAREAIADLIGHAADTSRWAVDLGADGLQPGARVIDIGWADAGLMARIHIAYAPDTPQDERDRLAADIADAIAGTVPVR